MCSRACPSLFWLLHNSRRRALERQSSVRPGPEPQGLKDYAVKVGANGEIMLSIAGCLLQDAEHKNYRIYEDTRQLKLKTELCMQATSGLGNALSKCHITHEDFDQACMDLAELVEEYEPELMRLPENAPKYATAQAVQEYGASKQRALRMLQRAEVLLLNNSPEQFLGHALGQIAAASQGQRVQDFVMESCGEGTRCFEMAEVLKDFKQDLLEAQGKAAERHSLRVQELEHQIVIATQADIKALAALQQRYENAEAAKATLEQQAQAANELCSILQRRLLESQQANKSLRCQLHEQEQVAQGLQAESANLQTELSAERENAKGADQTAHLLKSQLTTQEQKAEELIASLREEHAQELQPVQGELDTTNSKLADSQNDVLAAERVQSQMGEAASELLTQLAAAQEALLTEQQDHRDAKQTSEGLQAHLQATEQRRLELQTQLEKAQEQKLVDAQAHEDAIAECQRQVRAAEQTGSSLQTKWEAANQELAPKKQAHQAAKQTVAEVQVELGKEASRAKSLHQDLQEAQADLANLKQASQVGAEAAPAAQMQQEAAAQHYSSSLQNEQKLAEELSQVQAHHGTLTAPLQENTSGKDANTLPALPERPGDLASMRQAEQAGEAAHAALHSQQEKAAQHCPSTLQETPGDLASTRQARQTREAAIVASQMQLEEAAQHHPSFLQELHGSEVKMHAREGRPEAGDSTQLMAALRQVHPSPAPQDETALVEVVSRRQAKHGAPTAPLQQDTPGRDTTTLLRKHGMQQELQRLQKDLQDTTAALHLSNDSLQESNSTIDCLRTQMEASQAASDQRRTELLLQVDFLKAQPMWCDHTDPGSFTVLSCERRMLNDHKKGVRDMEVLKTNLAQAQGQIESQGQFITALQERLSVPVEIGMHGMWTGKTALASGANGSAFLVTNPFFPHAVLKKGWEHLLEEEAEKLWVLRHPNIVTLYTRLQTGEIGPDGIRTGWLALQRCGPTLASLKARRPRLSGRDRFIKFTARELVVGWQGIFAGLAHMHYKGIVDQDIHLGNLLVSLDSKRWVKVDLGNAAWCLQQTPEQKPTKIFFPMNPFGHEPPEVTQELLTQGWYRPRPGQDVWACGMCMADMMAAKRPRQHLRHLNHPALAAERASSQRDISQLPMHEAYYRYLKGLGDCNVAYEQQVEFPAAPPGEEAAWKVLKHIVRACLRVDPRRASPAARMPACQAQEELFAFMQQQKWSDDVSATDAQVV